MGKKNNVTPLTSEELQAREEKKQVEELQGYMRGRPNREEVAQYVNNLLEQKYMPEILKQIGLAQQSMQLGLMALQAILINKELCTGDEIKQVTQEFIIKFNEDLKKSEEGAKQFPEKVSRDIENDTEHLE